VLKVPRNALMLSFEDLLPDPDGNVVILSAGDHPQLSIVTDRKVCDAGVAETHVIADGVDVAGLCYYTLEGGTKLYYSPDIDLTIAPVSA
jgi:hypothetical protein